MGSISSKVFTHGVRKRETEMYLFENKSGIRNELEALNLFGIISPKNGNDANHCLGNEPCNSLGKCQPLNIQW